MLKEENISVFKKDDSVMYTGKLRMNIISYDRIVCSYNLSNEKDPAQKLQGSFEGNFKGLAQILAEVDSIVNTTVSESN